MKLLHKIILSSVTALALVPAGTQAHGAMRALAKPGVMKAAKAFIKHPSFIMAGLGAVSIAYAKNKIKTCEVDHVRCLSCEDNAATVFSIGTALLGGSLYYSMLPRLIKTGHLPKLSNKTAFMAAGLGIFGSQLIRDGMFFKSHDEHLNSLGKFCNRNWDKLLLGGIQACVLSGVYLTVA